MRTKSVLVGIYSVRINKNKNKKNRSEQNVPAELDVKEFCNNTI